MHKLLRSNINHAVVISITLLLGSIAVEAKQPELSNKPEVRVFIETMVDKHQFDSAELVRLLNQAEIKPKIITAISRPAESKPWHEYRPIFLTTKRIDQGVEFLKNNRALLTQAEQAYGVPAEIITAILGVETFYGRHKGGYRVIDSLTTLAFEYPPRSQFFMSELEHFLLMTREEKIDPLSVTGSYAGAMGQPQFISSSFRSYAIDFDNDGQRDLWQNQADAIGSIANYFKRHGWQAGAEIVSHANGGNSEISALAKKGIKPHTPVRQIQQHGISLDKPLPGDEDAAVIELELKNGYEYWVGLKNFYVITRYNHSALYAMAVYQLAEEIRKNTESVLTDDS